MPPRPPDPDPDPTDREDALAPVRLEHLVRVDLPAGTVDEMAVDSAHVAYVLAAVLPANYALRGITATATALTRIWALVDETEITDPFPDRDTP